MPSTNISYNTLATVNVGALTFAGPLLFPGHGLRPGLNTLAVEVHQVASVSPDVCFGTELLGFPHLTPARPFRDSTQSWGKSLCNSHPVELTGWRLMKELIIALQRRNTGAAVMSWLQDVGLMQSLYPGLDVVGLREPAFQEQRLYRAPIPVTTWPTKCAITGRRLAPPRRRRWLESRIARPEG
jgi:hypothetical protein